MDMSRGCVLLVVFITGSLADLQLLPSPVNISMVSINLKHTLHWDPVMVPGNVTYSVQTQGEFESRFVSHYWHEIKNCWNISAHKCDVTQEVSTSVMYKFRVQTLQGDRLSAWAELDPPFNRRSTLLTLPKVELQVSELNLVAQIKDYGADFTFFIFYWKKGGEDDVNCITTSSYDVSTYLEKAEEGKEYCAEVIAYARPINRNSSRSDTVCVQVKGAKQSVVFITLLSIFGVVLVFVPIVLGVWKFAYVLRYYCCPDEDIPEMLKEPNMGQRMLRNSHSSEDSEEINNVELLEHRLLENSSFIVKMPKL
ncbi:interleukin-20 receptor subunit beta isoform X1 [Engystomops pustulosus]|uniref:interleukin-20 receptor subunit beta isoform X1 n=2 Tax=Engystomops pustulosus TaxID=76066 RepID=UPI003AFB1C6B